MTTEPEAVARPLYRAWVATALMEALFGLLFIPSVFLSLDLLEYDSSEDSPSGVGGMMFGAGLLVLALAAYFYAAAIAYIVTALALIPVVAHTLGRYIDSRTGAWRTLSTALVFAGVASVPGLFIARSFLKEEGNIVLLLVLNYAVVPALAAFGTRMLLPVALKVKAVRVIAIVLGSVAVAMAVVAIIWFLAEANG